MNILAVSGSLRTASYNRMALKIAMRIAKKTGATVREADLKTLALPLYDGDIEDAGMPPSVTKLKKMVEACDVLIIASPENNHSISAPLKNALDWLSRGKNSLSHKHAAIFGASDGNFGTVRGQAHLRQILAALNVIVLPQPQILIRNCKTAFTDKGEFVDEMTTKLLTQLIEETIAYAK